MARGFIYAGCSSLVMTLWTVEDKSGAKLMTHFYTNLKDGIDKAKSLQQAKIEFLQNADQLKSHPYFWSGYVVIGNNNPLFKSNYFYIAIVTSGLLGSLLIFIGIKKIKTKL